MYTHVKIPLSDPKNSIAMLCAELASLGQAFDKSRPGLTGQIVNSINSVEEEIVSRFERLEAKEAELSKSLRNLMAKQPIDDITQAIARGKLYGAEEYLGTD